MGTLSVDMLLLGWSGPKSMHSRLKVTQQRRDPSPGRHRPESGVAMHRIRRSASTGNGGRDQTETVVAMHRITQSLSAAITTTPASGRGGRIRARMPLADRAAQVGSSVACMTDK